MDVSRGVETKNWQDVNDTSDAFSIISVKIHVSTVRHTNATTDALPSSLHALYFNFGYSNYFTRKLELFNDFDNFLTSSGRTADKEQKEMGALYTRK